MLRNITLKTQPKKLLLITTLTLVDFYECTYDKHSCQTSLRPNLVNDGFLHSPVVQNWQAIVVTLLKFGHFRPTSHV